MGTAAIISLVAALGSLGYNIYKGYVDRNKLAKSSKEAMSYQDALEDENAQDAYERQVEFQENYLTPAAQLKSQAAGYDAIGLNRMLLAGSQPGASAATSPQASASGQGQVPLPSMEGLASILGTAIDAKKAELGFKLQSEQNTINRFNAETERMRAEADIKYRNLQSEGQDITNAWLNNIYGSQVANTNADTDLKVSQQNNLVEVTKTEKFRQELAKRDIKIKDEELFIASYQKAITKAVSDNAPKYYAAQAKLATAQALLAHDQSGIFHQLLTKRVAAARAELNGIIIDAGLKARVWDGDAFEHQTSGTMTDKEKTEMWVGAASSVLNTVVGGAIGYGLGSMGRAAAPTPLLSYPGYGTFTPADVAKMTGNQPIVPYGF